MATQCLLDLDGTICNFVKRRLEMAGIHDPKWYDQFPGEINMQLLMGMSDIQFYGELNRHFWANLEWMPDGQRIVDELERRFGKENICICTSPTKDDECIPGKKEWIKRNLGRHYLRHTIFTNVKHFAAGPNKILIDDSHRNVDEFVANGGQAFLLPRIWNRDHQKRDAAIYHLITRIHQ